eukprot:CAMPEP_0176477854 /NCGR_PEP_ID=MMETSP0200_2-20121128/867_1 /TAXON_ID=947934 /ORGANISM="Chaetoceros sp., Strain GSL56" /LENGTH=1243 /DNA_ID=CAMNT_0017873737 /DNA_START=112 /DNA_END=3844 /DNA_ORIENTATION=-
MASSSSSIQVVVRLRPMNEMEKKHSTLPVIKASTTDRTVTVIKGQGPRQARSIFSFDNVFGSFSTQEEVFEATLKPVIADVMLGYESTIFAYGQTGTGKTHTMEGSLSSPELYGIIPRSAQAIFEAIKKPEIENTNVKCSYLEIYNEDLGDLLADEVSDELSNLQQSNLQKNCTNLPTPSKKKKPRLEIMEGPDGPFCRGLTEVTVYSATDVLKLMHKAQQLRKVGETRMNRHSSRSHCLFTIKIEATRRLNDGNTIDFCGKLHMVDLAGSECAKSAAFDKGIGDQVARERERMNINRSLLTLGRVIKLLKEQSEKKGNNNNSIRIPYRDSKLTRILQESLGGRCKTLIVATLSPSITAIEESMSTLHYAQSANGIINKPISCSKMSLSSSTFSSDTASTGEPNSVDTWHEMECRLEYMQSQVEEAQAALARKHLQQQELVDRAEKAEAELNAVEVKLFEAKQENIKLSNDIISEREQKEAIASQQRKTEIELRKTAAILEATRHTELCLTNEATSLLRSLEQSIQDGEALYLQLANARDDVVQKRESAKKFHTTTISLLATALMKLNELSTREKENMIKMAHLASEGYEREDMFLNKTIDFVKTINADVTKFSSMIENNIACDDGMKSLLADIDKNSIAVRSTVNDGEKTLRSVIESIQRHLTEYTTQIQQMDSEFVASCQSVTSSMESIITESKSKVSAVLASAVTSLRNANDAHTKTQEQLASVLSNILGSTESSLTGISENARIESNQLNDLLVSFRNSAQFDQMSSELDREDKFLKSQGSTHFATIEELKNIIKSQQISYEMAAAKQKQKQDEMLRQVGKEIQKIISDGVNGLTQLSENQFQEFAACNQTMLTANKAVKSSAGEFISGIQETSGKLRCQIKLGRENHNDMEKAVSKTSGILKDITNKSDTLKFDVKTSVKHGENNLKELVRHMDAVCHTRNQLVTDYAVVEQFLSEEATQKAKSNIEVLKSGTIILSRFATDVVIQNTQSDIEEATKPRFELMSKTLTSIDTIKEAFQSKSEVMGKIMGNQSIAATDLMSHIDSKYVDYANTISNAARDEMKDHKQKLTITTDEHSLLSSKITANCSSIIESTKGKISDFSIDTLQCYEVVQPLGEKVMINYDSKFTSTPSESTIIHALNLPTKETIVLKDILNEEDNMSMKSKELSESSISEVESQASSSLPRPPMNVTSTMVNKENVYARVEKPRSNSTLRAGKRRANSRPRATKKRVPYISTPTK